jgi:hypothetical protein
MWGRRRVHFALAWSLDCTNNEAMRSSPVLAAAALLGVLCIGGCSLGLPDTIDGYGRKQAQAGGPDAPSSLVGAFGVDASLDSGAVGIADAGPSDATATPDAPLACPPAPIVGFSPQPWSPPAAIHRNACTSQQATTLAGCLMTTAGNTPSCDNFMYSGQNGTCIECGVTSITAAHRGPILDDGQSYWTNPAGCVAALSGDSSTTGCGATLDILVQCEDAACYRCGDADYQACIDAADRGECSAYAYGLTCSSLYQTACMGNSVVDEALKLVKLFCMP